MADLETDDLRQLSKQPPGEGADQVDLSDETQDFRFLGMFAGIGNSGGGKKGAAADPTIPKRGEKDFAPDGTDLQSRVLAESREAMHNALSGVRTHTSKVNVHCTWRPSRGKAEVKVAKGTHFKAMGVADKEGVLWLEREEVVYLVERGGVECWWEEGIPMSLQGVYAECLGNAGAGAIERYQVYAYLKRSGYIVQRAETFPAFDAPLLTPSLPSILKTPLNSISYHPPHRLPPTGFFPSLFHLLFRPILHPTPSSTGPLIPYQTTLRSHVQIYSRLSLIPCHHPSLSPPTPTYPENTPFKITYNVWKPQPHFKKTDPGTPDFRICVISTAEHEGILTLGEISGLLESVPLEYPPLPRIAKEKVKEADGSKKKQQGKDKATTTTTTTAGNGSGSEKKKTTSTWESKSIYQRLKDGRRGVILAVVDMGVISFTRVGDVGFGEEKLWEGSGPRRKGGQRGSGQAKGKGKASGKNTAGGGASTI